MPGSGQRESGTARLEQAVTAYREALKEYTRERVPLELGHDPDEPRQCAPERSAERESGTARLEQAVAAYRAALEGAHPRARAARTGRTTQMNLGNALVSLAEREPWRLGSAQPGTARLEQAVAAYREALKEYTRERVPLELGHDRDEPRQCALEHRGAQARHRACWSRRLRPTARP